MESKAFFLSILLLLFSQSAFADWTKVASKDFEMENYPAEGTAEYKADYAELLVLQKNRSVQDCALAQKQKYPDFKLLFGDSAKLLTTEEISSVAPLLNRVTKLSDRISEYFKHEFERPRPFSVDKRIQPCVEKPAGALSYPSGHTVIASVDGCVLAELFPKRAKKLEEYASYLGDLRAVVGVHHPSDVAAGKQLGADICEYLLGDETFQAEIKELKKEL